MNFCQLLVTIEAFALFYLGNQGGFRQQLTLKADPAAAPLFWDCLYVINSYISSLSKQSIFLLYDSFEFLKFQNYLIICLLISPLFIQNSEEMNLWEYERIQLG